MNDLLVKILFTVLSLYAGVLTFLLKTAWSRIENNHDNILNLKADYSKCIQETQDDTDDKIDKLLVKIGDMIDVKLDAWWNKIECNLMNDGRLPPKRIHKKDQP